MTVPTSYSSFQGPLGQWWIPKSMAFDNRCRHPTAEWLGKIEVTLPSKYRESMIASSTFSTVKSSVCAPAISLCRWAVACRVQELCSRCRRPYSLERVRLSDPLSSALVLNAEHQYLRRSTSSGADAVQTVQKESPSKVIPTSKPEPQNRLFIGATPKPWARVQVPPSSETGLWAADN